MPIKLPRIWGTGYDAALNEFIDSVNREKNANQPKLAAHAVAAIGRFLIERHEVEAFTRWITEAMPLVNQITVIDPMVDKLYHTLVQRVTHAKGRGCTGAALFLIAVLAVAVLVGWWFM